MSKPKPTGRRPTIRDVATVAGVSRGTVSRVLNGGHWVSEDALAAVNRAIKETGYAVNQHARSLTTRRSNSVAFLLTEPQHLLFEDPNFSVLLRGAAQALADREMTLVLMIAGTPDERRRVQSYISAGHVDGVLLVSTHSGNPLVHSLLGKGVPTIACGRPLGFEGRLGYVAADDRDGARQMTTHLVGRGRRTIATITGPMDTSGGVERLAGYRDVVGDDYDETLVEHGDYSRGSGYLAMCALLERRPDLDAVFVASDLMAAGALGALMEWERSVPGDVSVGGFDDSGMAENLHPRLTTMRQPFERISSEMVRLLLTIVDGEDPAAVTVPTTLVTRQST